jgi:hypothetical protein
LTIKATRSPPGAKQANFYSPTLGLRRIASSQFATASPLIFAFLDLPARPTRKLGLDMCSFVQSFSSTVSAIARMEIDNDGAPQWVWYDDHEEPSKIEPAQASAR